VAALDHDPNKPVGSSATTRAAGCSGSFCWSVLHPISFQTWANQLLLLLDFTDVKFKRVLVTGSEIPHIEAHRCITDASIGSHWLTVLPLLVNAQLWSLVVSLVLFVLLHAILLFSTCVPLFPFSMLLVFCLNFL
jgi:hypothetical protein